MKGRRLEYQFGALIASLMLFPASFAAAPAGAQARLNLQRPVPDFAPMSGAERRSGGVLDRVDAQIRGSDAPVTLGAYVPAPEKSALAERPGFQLPATRWMSPAETIAARARREGVPFARLWESKSALVSVGLNQKGHLGLWLMQKSH